MNLHHTEEDIKYDIQETIEVILKNKLSYLSSQLIDQIKSVCWDFELLIDWEDTTKIDLKNILEDSEISDLEQKYFQSFSPKTQEFILKYLPKSISWNLIINIDGFAGSQKKIDIEIIWQDINNQEIYNKFSYHSTSDILFICNELYTKHYLWLGLNYWKENDDEEEYYINSITIRKPNKNTKKIEIIHFPPQNNIEEA